jgi:hypothetical protein
MLAVSITVRRPWPGPWARVVLVVIILVFMVHWAPAMVLPLAAGGWLSRWLVTPSAQVGVSA